MFSVHCDDIQQDQLQNGQTVNITGTEVGDTATFSCKAGYVFLGNQSIEKKCQETGWSGGGIQTCVGMDNIDYILTFDDCCLFKVVPNTTGR